MFKKRGKCEMKKIKIELHPEKDQHLLVNEKIIKQIVKEAKLSREDKILEIGAGTGILTSELVKKAKKVLAFEIDENFKEELNNLKSRKLEIIYDNALNYNWEGYNKIVANIPYSLSEPIVLKAIQDDIEFMVLTIGENFKEIINKKETKIGILADLFFDTTNIVKVDKKNFTPVPKTDSWIVKFERKVKINQIDLILQKIVMKKGKIKNALMYSIVESGRTKNQAREIIEKLNIDRHVLNKPVQSITGKFIMLLRERMGGEGRLNLINLSI